MMYYRRYALSGLEWWVNSAVFDVSMHFAFTHIKMQSNEKHIKKWEKKYMFVEC